MILVILTAIVSVGILLIIVAFSCVMYFRARRLNPYNRTREKLESAIAAARDNYYYVKEQIKQLEAEKLAVQQIIDKKEAMEKFINDFQKDYDDKKLLIDKMNEDIKEITSKLQAADDDLKKKNKELTELQEDQHKLDKKIKDQQEKHDSLITEINKKNDQIKELDKQIEGLKIQVDNLRLDIQKLKEEKISLERQTEEARAKSQDVLTQYEQGRQKLEELTTDLEASKIQWAKEEGREKAEKTRWEDLDRPYFDKDTIPMKDEDEESMLNGFKEALKDSNIIFSDRTINAFHTSLKSEDASPLVVLAGISGTGKSLLPSLYARAFRMNFLSVAVQPRWDSPQDMFGFYNYMQNRYKATELSRMLWQFDIFNNKAEVIKKYPTEDSLPMNIVLLDEMNLARVEYYFSDMLSKLEQRRSISDKFDDDARKTAEIEIEGGSIGDSESARRLFVDSNTLFVGTMNEDETTQTLSDKVMDRANVLRFGMPESINAKMDNDVFFKKYPDDGRYMQYSSWKKLCREKKLRPDLMERLDLIVTELNQNMVKINHPFAYRVWRSIETYVSMYPCADKDPASFNAALADQIEMKILPKLNGVDMSESAVSDVLRSMLGTIEKVKDDELTETFSEVISSRNSNTFFQWKGVSR